MKEFIDKLIERLEGREKYYHECALDEIMENGHTLDAEGFLGKEDAYGDAISIVNQLAEEYKVSEMPTGWISVSERFPKEDFYCILTVEYTNGNKEVNFGWFDRASVCWYVGAGEFRTTNVLAWMPFPAPFKEGE